LAGAHPQSVTALVFLEHLEPRLAAWASAGLNFTCTNLGVLNEHIRLQSQTQKVIGTVTSNWRGAGLTVVERQTNLVEVLAVDGHRFHAFGHQHASLNHATRRNDGCPATVFQAALLC